MVLSARIAALLSILSKEVIVETHELSLQALKTYLEDLTEQAAQQVLELPILPDRLVGLLLLGE